MRKVMEITMGPDPAPLTLRVAARLKRALLENSLIEEVQRPDITVGIRFAESPQRVSIRFQAGQVRVFNNVEEDVDLLLLADHDSLGKLSRAATRDDSSPDEMCDDYYTLLTGLLNAPLPPLEVLARRFWQRAAGMKGVPDGLVLHCSDYEEPVHLGDDDGCYEIHGNGAAIAAFLTGDHLLIDLVARGELRVEGTLGELSALTGAGLEVLLSE
jgi:hypothetical protein